MTKTTPSDQAKGSTVTVRWRLAPGVASLLYTLAGHRGMLLSDAVTMALTDGAATIARLTQSLPEATDTTDRPTLRVPTSLLIPRPALTSGKGK